MTTKFFKKITSVALSAALLFGGAGVMGSPAVHAAELNFTKAQYDANDISTFKTMRVLSVSGLKMYEVTADAALQNIYAIGNYASGFVYNFKPDGSYTTMYIPGAVTYYELSALNVSPNNRYLSYSWNRPSVNYRSYIYDQQTQSVIYSYTDSNAGTVTVFSPGSRYAVVAYKAGTGGRIVDLATGTAKTFSIPAGWVDTPGSRPIVNDDGSVYISLYNSTDVKASLFKFDNSGTASEVKQIGAKSSIAVASSGDGSEVYAFASAPAYPLSNGSRISRIDLSTGDMTPIGDGTIPTGYPVSFPEVLGNGVLVSNNRAVVNLNSTSHAIIVPDQAYRLGSTKYAITLDQPSGLLKVVDMTVADFGDTPQTIQVDAVSDKAATDTINVRWERNRYASSLEIFQDGTSVYQYNNTVWPYNTYPSVLRGFTRDVWQSYTLTGTDITKDHTFRVILKDTMGNVVGDGMTQYKSDNVKLGSLTVKRNARVNIGNDVWYPIDDNLLIRDKAYSEGSTTTFKYDDSGTAVKFDQTSLMARLADWLTGGYLSATELEALDENHVFSTIEYGGAVNNYAYTSFVGIPSLAEFGNPKGYVGATDVGAAFMTSGSGQPRTYNRTTGASTSATASSVASVLPVIAIKPGTTFTGLGTAISPYKVSGQATPVKPATPTGLKQTGTTGEIPVSLSWNAVSGVAGYKVFRDGVMIGNPVSNSFTDMSTTSGKTYSYTISATGNGSTTIGDSDLSQALSVTTNKVLVKPTGLKVDSDKKGAVQISWTAELGLSYKVYRNGVLVDTVADNKYIDTLGKVGDKVTYAVESTDGTVASPKSDTVEVTITSAVTLTAPQGVTVVSDEEGSVKVSWQAVAGADGYNVYLDGQKVKQVAALSYTNADLLAGSSHTVYVEADDNQGTVGPASDTVTISVKAKPPVVEPVTVPSPQNFRVLGKTTTSTSLAWAKVEGATYKLTKNGGTVYEGANSAFNVTGLNPSTGYAMEVFAILDGKTSKAATLDIVTNDEVVPYPMGLTVTEVAYDHVSLAWNPVAGVDGYVITRNGQEIDTVQGASFQDTNPTSGATNYYGVSAIKGSLTSKEARKSVYAPVQAGSAPDAPVGVKVTRIHHDSVTLEWPYTATASEYQVFRDDNTLVYKGPLTSITDLTVAPQTSYMYKVVAVNANGKAESQPIGVTTAAVPQPIPVYPAEPQSGKITFEFATVTGAYMYGVERNPLVTYTDNGDGTWTKWYYNTVTQENENQGIVTPTADGRLPFSEDGVMPGQDYTYKITAYKLDANGAQQEIGSNEQTVTAPADGTGGTPSAPNPGTTPTDPGTTPTTPTTPTNPGTTPTTPTTPTDPGTTPTNPGTGSGENTETGANQPTPSNPGTTTPGTTTPPVVENPSPEVPTFSDVPASHYAHDAITQLALRGVVTGYPNGSFGVDKTITRAEFAIMTKRALGYEDNKPLAKKFSDLSENGWYAKELATAINRGVTKGFSDGTYHPNDLIPREQAAVMVSNVLRNHSIGFVAGFKAPDIDKAVAWAKTDIAYAGGVGILKGDSNGNVYPKKSMTRGEAAVIINRLLQVIE